MNSSSKIGPLALIVALFLSSWSRAAAETYLAIAASYTPEIVAVRKAFAADKTRVAEKTIHGIRFEMLDFEGKKLLFFPTGMSLTNAAMSTQIALDHFPISAVFFAGIAGGINPTLQPGDVTIPSRWFYHSEAAYFNEKGSDTYEVAPYFQKKYPNFGMIFPDDVFVTRPGLKKPIQQASFPADPKLLALARKAQKNGPPLRVGKRSATVKIGGPAVSGTVFMDNANYRKWVWSIWRADCLDMESTAIAQVCWVNRKPCLIVRALSDLAGGQKGANQIEDYETISSENAANMLKKIIGAM